MVVGHVLGDEMQGSGNTPPRKSAPVDHTSFHLKSEAGCAKPCLAPQHAKEKEKEKEVAFNGLKENISNPATSTGTAKRLGRKLLGINKKNEPKTQKQNEEKTARH